MDSELKLDSASSMVKHDLILKYIRMCSFLLMGFVTLGVFLYKIAVSKIGFEMSALNTTDVLSVFLAIFSVALSVMFYFKSSEESARFYNNSYKFTRDVSEILGRIEAGFGERLRHIDEGYATIRQKFDGVTLAANAAKEQVAEEQEDIKRAVEERDALIKDLLGKANLGEEEKKRIAANLAEKEGELDYAKRQLFVLEQRLKELKSRSEMHGENNSAIDSAILELASYIDPKHFFNAPHSWLERRLKETFPKLSAKTTEVLKETGIIDGFGAFDSEGRETLRRFAHAWLGGNPKK